jgi:hypothetical protein
MPVIAYDIFATSIAAAGGKLKEDRVYHGQDLLKIKSGTYDFKRPLFWSRGKNFAILEGKWKLLITEKQTSLFNLSEDKSEKKDLSVHYPEMKEELQKKLMSWKETHAKALWSSGFQEKKKKRVSK